MQIQNIKDVLDQANAKHVVLLCHHNADPDAIGAAFAFSNLLLRLRPGLHIEIAAAEGPSRLSRRIMAILPMKLVQKPKIEAADAIVLLDTNTVQQLNDWKEKVESSDAPLIVVDHHAEHPDTERLATLSVTDENASSTCEIVYKFFKDMNVRLSKAEAEALFLGIAFDTRHFVLAKSETFKTIADLVDSNVNAQEALSLLRLPMEGSERMARIKASKRATHAKIGEWIVGWSHVSTHQASAANALISLGAHVAIVAGQKNQKLTVSMRASREFYNATGIHLGRELAKPLGKYLQGMGGGHAVAAGVNGTGNLETCLNRCVNLLESKLKKDRSNRT